MPLMSRPCPRIWSNVPAGDETFFGSHDPFEKADESVPKLVFPWPNGPEPLTGLRATSTPPLLLACRQSSKVAKKHYTRAFGVPGICAEVWFNFTLDTLYLDYFDACHYVNATDAKKTQRLAVIVRRDKHIDRYSRVTMQMDVGDVRKVFRHLKSYTVAIPYHDNQDGQELVALGGTGLMRHSHGLAKDPAWEEIVEQHFPGIYDQHVGRGLDDNPGSYFSTAKYPEPLYWSKIYTTRQKHLKFLKAKKRYERSQDRQVSSKNTTSVCLASFRKCNCLAV